jgi:hypothetical protein
MDLETSDLAQSEACVAWVQKQLQILNDSLGAGQSIEAVIPLADGSQIVANAFGYCNPDLIKINGVDSDGNEVCLILHKSSFQVLFRAANQGPEIKPQIAFQDPSQNQPQQILFNETA